MTRGPLTPDTVLYAVRKSNIWKTQSHDHIIRTQDPRDNSGFTHNILHKNSKCFRWSLFFIQLICYQGVYGDQFPFYYHKLTSYNHGILKFSFWCINKKSKLTALSMFAAKFVINDSAMRTNNISIYNTVVKRFTGIEINGSLRSEEGTSSETSAIMALKNL